MANGNGMCSNMAALLGSALWSTGTHLAIRCGRAEIEALKRHTPEQFVRKFASADRMLGEGKDVADVCRESQVSEQTYYR